MPERMNLRREAHRRRAEKTAALMAEIAPRVDAADPAAARRMRKGLRLENAPVVRSGARPVPALTRAEIAVAKRMRDHGADPYWLRD